MTFSQVIFFGLSMYHDLFPLAKSVKSIQEQHIRLEKGCTISSLITKHVEFGNYMEIRISYLALFYQYLHTGTSTLGLSHIDQNCASFASIVIALRLRCCLALGTEFSSHMLLLPVSWSQSLPARTSLGWNWILVSLAPSLLSISSLTVTYHHVSPWWFHIMSHTIPLSSLVPPQSLEPWYLTHWPVGSERSVVQLVIHSWWKTDTLFAKIAIA